MKFYEYQRPYDGKEYPVTRGWINPEKVVCIEENELLKGNGTTVHLDNGDRRLFAKPIEEVFRLIFGLTIPEDHPTEKPKKSRLEKYVDAQKAKNKR